MKHYFKLVIDKTARPMGRLTKDSFWQKYDQEVKEFKTIKEVKDYLKDQYFYCKTKYKTYTEETKGQTGWIYAFKSDPYSYDDVKHYEQHWINLYKIISTPILF